MFNVYQYDKEYNLQQKELEEHREAKSRDRLRKMRTNQYVKRYNNRVDQFIHSTTLNPADFNLYTSPLKYEPRPFDPSKFKGKSQIIIKGFMTEKERIKESIIKNQSLDTHPLIANLVDLRQRDKSKELSQIQQRKKIMHRPISLIKLPLATSDSDESSSNNSEQLLNSSATRISKDGENNKVVFHNSNKTHFKAAVQKMMKEPKGKLKLKKDEWGLVHKLPIGTLQPIINLLKKNEVISKAVGRPRLLQLLEDCKIIEPMRNSKFLRKGKGHLMINPDKYNSELLPKVIQKAKNPVFGTGGNHVQNIPSRKMNFV